MSRADGITIVQSALFLCDLASLLPIVGQDDLLDLPAVPCAPQHRVFGVRRHLFHDVWKRCVLVISGKAYAAGVDYELPIWQLYTLWQVRMATDDDSLRYRL